MTSPRESHQGGLKDLDEPVKEERNNVKLASGTFASSVGFVDLHFSTMVNRLSCEIV